MKFPYYLLINTHFKNTSVVEVRTFSMKLPRKETNLICNGITLEISGSTYSFLLVECKFGITYFQTIGSMLKKLIECTSIATPQINIECII